MAQLIITLLLAICLAGNAVGQPRVINSQIYSLINDAEWEAFNDIFATEDGGYVACGRSGPRNYWITKVDSDLEVQWSRTYESYYRGLQSIIQTDDGGYLAGGLDGNISEFSAILTDDEGEPIWEQTYGTGICLSVLELKNDNFLLIGQTSAIRAYLVLTNPQGEPIWEREYGPPQGQQGLLRSGRETDGGVVLTGEWGSHNPSLWNMKVDFDGEPIWSNFSPAAGQEGFYGKGTTIVSMPGGGFMCGGYQGVQYEPYRMFVTKIDSDGEIEWSRFVDDQFHSIWGAQLANRRDEIVFTASIFTDPNTALPVIYKLSQGGEVEWRSIIANSDYGCFSVVYSNDGSIAATGYHWDGRRIYFIDAFIVEIEPEVVGPTIVFHAPSTTDQIVSEYPILRK